MEDSKISILAAAGVGALSAVIAGIYGDSFFNAVFAGAITGAIIGYTFSEVPRSFNDPRIAIESFSPAGALGAVAGTISANAGWGVGIASSWIGWLLGIVLPGLAVGVLLGLDHVMNSLTVRPQQETESEPIPHDLKQKPNTRIYRFDEDHPSVRMESVARAVGEMNRKTIAKLKHTPLVTGEDEIAFGAEVIELCEQVFDESNNVNNSFFLNDKPSQYITELDIEDFGGDLVSLTRRIVEFEKAKANLASPYSTFCKVISKDDSDSFGDDFIDLMRRVTNDCLNGHRYKRVQINTDSVQTHAAHQKSLEHNFKPMEPSKLAEHQKPLGGNPGRSLDEIKAQPKNSPQRE